jgi:hypothetical protein
MDNREQVGNQPLAANMEVRGDHQGQVGGPELRPDSRNGGEEQVAPDNNQAAENHCREGVNQGQGDASSENNWSNRNPMKQVIPCQARKKISPAEQASRALLTEANKTTRTLLMQAVDDFLEDRAKKIEELAAKHNVTPEYVKKLVNPITTYKKHRAPTLPNAIAHIKAIEINESEILSRHAG